MSEISAYLETTGTIHTLLKTIDKALESKPKALTLLLATDNGFTKETLDPILTALKLPVSGGLFNKIIFKESLLEKGSIVIAWNNPISITNYKNIENTNSLKDLIGVTTQPQSEKDIGEYLLFMDGAVASMEENLDALYNKTGFRATFAGGGAGKSPIKASPCIITNEGLLSNAMQTIATNHKTKTTSTHGWGKQSGPHLVTSSNKNRINTLDYDPIISFYRKHNTKFGKHRVENTDFSTFFQSYLIGIEKLDGEILVREPYKHTNENIDFIGNIPEYSKVQILSGSKDSARTGVDKELTDLNLKAEENIDAAFIFNCADRDDADHNGFSKELKMLNKHLAGSKHILGVQTIGEFATSESRLLHLHSKTIVISRLTGVST